MEARVAQPPVGVLPSCVPGPPGWWGVTELQTGLGEEAAATHPELWDEGQGPLCFLCSPSM